MTSRPSPTPIRNLKTSITIFCRACIRPVGPPPRASGGTNPPSSGNFFWGPRFRFRFSRCRGCCWSRGIDCCWRKSPIRDRIVDHRVFPRSLCRAAYGHGRLLLMLGMRSCGAFVSLGRALGVGLTRLIVLFSLLMGPVYFAQADSSQPTPPSNGYRGTTCCADVLGACCS